MIYGIWKPIDDPLFGRIPAKTPLDFARACRATNVRLKRGRVLVQEPEFAAALAADAMERRWREEPTNFARALEIRDRPGTTPLDRALNLAAIDYIRGELTPTGRRRRKAHPKAAERPQGEAQGGCGYVIGLADASMAGQEPASASAEIIPLQPRDKYAGLPSDAEIERRENRTPKPSRG